MNVLLERRSTRQFVHDMKINWNNTHANDRGFWMLSLFSSVHGDVSVASMVSYGFHRHWWMISSFVVCITFGQHVHENHIPGRAAGEKRNRMSFWAGMKISNALFWVTHPHQPALSMLVTKVTSGSFGSCCCKWFGAWCVLPWYIKRIHGSTMLDIIPGAYEV